MEDGKPEIQLSRRSDSPVGNRACGSGCSGGGFGETLILRHKEVHNFFFVPFREQPIYSTRAHVFQIDPNTKKNWLPSSKHAVTVSYFYDSTRNVYRIISLDGTKVRSAPLIPPPPACRWAPSMDFISPLPTHPLHSVFMAEPSVPRGAPGEKLG